MFYGSGSSRLPGRCPAPARGLTRSPAASGNDLLIACCAFGAKITLASNTGVGHNFLVPLIMRVTIFYANAEEGFQLFNLTIS